MTDPSHLAPELQARVEALAARAGCPVARIVTDALEHGHSLDLQEHWVDRVLAGLTDAKAGRFATTADVERVLNKYRQHE